MIRILVIGLILIINFVLQTTMLTHIQIIGIQPNTMLLIVVTYAMLRGDVEGAIVGFFAGLMQDVLFGRVIGLYAMLGLLLGFFCGKPFKDFYKENYTMPILLVSIACFAYEFAFYFLFFLFQGNVDLLYYFGRIMLPGTVYTVMLTIPIYRLMYAVNNKLETHEKSMRRLF